MAAVASSCGTLSVSSWISSLVTLLPTFIYLVYCVYIYIFFLVYSDAAAHLGQELDLLLVVLRVQVAGHRQRRQGTLSCRTAVKTVKPQTANRG